MRTTLLSSIEETPVESIPGVMSVQFSLSGDPHAAAVVDAVLYDYAEVVRAPLTAEELRALDGSRITVMRTGESMFGASSIAAEDGTVFLSGDSAALLPKGKRKNGFRLTPGRILDYTPGYNGHDVLRSRVDKLRARFPQVEALTREHLLALPERAPDPAQIGLMVFGTWPGFGERSPGAVWALHSYMPEDDIVEGYLFVRPEHGVSEHGSVLGEQLLRWGGRILNPPALSLRDCFALGDLPYAEALARFVLTATAIH